MNDMDNYIRWSRRAMECGSLFWAEFWGPSDGHPGRARVIDRDNSSDESSVTYFLTRGIVADLIDAAGAVEDAVVALDTALAEAQAIADKHIGPHPDSEPWPEFGKDLQDPTIIRARWRFAEVVVWTRSFLDRLKREDVTNRGGHLGLIPQLSDLHPLKAEVVPAWTRLKGRLRAPRELLSQAAAKASAGNRVILGVWAEPGVPALQVDFGIDVTTPDPVYLGPEPWATRSTQIKRAFRDSAYSSSDSSSFEDLLVEWNREATSERSAGDVQAIESSWRAFVKAEVLQDRSIPPVGSLAYWESAPALCRSIFDAPESVRKSLSRGSLWLRLPVGWQGGNGFVLCVRTALGSNGCSEPNALDPTGYVWFDDVYAASGDPLTVQIARETDSGAVSWVDRVDLVDVPHRTLTSTHVVVVDLSAVSTPLARWEDTSVLPASIPAEISSLTAEDETALLEEIAKAQAVAGCTEECNAS